ncbi:nucleotidyltransferase family protein [Streptomyces rectiverticillatus]|uniref:nucleotidyltransferase family protein n=1 Tax=Streptomyces rectiverticillatus TaxID=173860 RepID=UPI0015C340A8|nr:nucleotidyltransferase family protein [Streptomyces rectiverticillatus]QLE74576.1 nucleotidyltransferase family protein [Streptomyces rectiverticillatus]
MTPSSPPVAGLLLAAGGGRRLGGRPKALLTLHGRPLVEHAARALHDGGCAPVYVVLGAAAAEVRVHAGLTHCTLVDNPDWPDGMGSSLRAGLAAVTASDAGAVLVTLVDQPRVGAAAVSRVLAAHRSGAQLAAASYGGERGHPVLFARPHWQGVARAASGDRGARTYLREHAAAVTLVECGDVAGPEDVDTPVDLRLLGRGGPPMG